MPWSNGEHGFSEDGPGGGIVVACGNSVAIATQLRMRES